MAELEKLKAGDPIRASWISKLVSLVLRSLRITANWPLQMHQQDGGATLGLAWYFELRIFELTERLNKGSSAQAVLLDWNLPPQTYSQPSAITDAHRIRVYDMLGTFTGSTGDRGYCFFSRSSGKWEIVQLEC